MSARKAKCAWLTEVGMPWEKTCGKPCDDKHVWCPEHEKSVQDNYPHLFPRPRIDLVHAGQYANSIRYRLKREYANGWIQHVFFNGSCPQPNGLGKASIREVRQRIGTGTR